MREIFMERKLINAVKTKGGIAPKFVSPGLDGMPDRIVLLPGGKIAFAEIKARGQLPKPIQMKRIKTLRELCFKVYVVSEEWQIGRLLDEVQCT